MSTTLSILNNLIETLKDGQEGFRTSAADVEAADLKTIFTEYSLQRSKFSGDLQALARSFGKNEPETNGSAAGVVHRGWMNLKAALSSKDEHAILAECERGEHSAVTAYKNALETEGLPRNILAVLYAQYGKLLDAHDRIRNFRDTLTKR